MRITSNHRENIAETADDILSRFQRLEETLDFSKPWARDSRDNLQHLINCDFLLMTPDDGVPSLVHEGHGNLVIENREEMARTVLPIDHGVVVRKSEEGGWFLCRVHGPLSMASVRGKVRRTTNLMLQYYHGWIGDDGEWHVDDAIVGIINNRWVNLQAGMTIKKGKSGWVMDKIEFDDQGQRNVELIVSMSLTARYDWHVALGTLVDEKGPRVLLPSSPRGCLSLLRDREKTGTRRASLKHWVTNHYRETSEDQTSYVRDHLRGHTKFEWHDLDGEIMVSQFDLDKNEFYREQAAEWRAKRKHNVSAVPQRQKMRGLRP